MSTSLPIAGQDDEIICAKCSRTRRTCCQVAEIYVTPGDRQRIADYTGRDDFWSFKKPENPKYMEGADEDPLWFACVATTEGTRAALHRVEGKTGLDCTFLGERGCVLPMETRPLVCRLYPFDYTQAGIRPILDVSYCPTHFLPPGRDMATELGMNIDDGWRWFEMIYEEIQQEPHSRATPEMKAEYEQTRDEGKAARAAKAASPGNAKSA